jgi:hypothetical protein
MNPANVLFYFCPCFYPIFWLTTKNDYSLRSVFVETLVKISTSKRSFRKCPRVEEFVYINYYDSSCISLIFQHTKIKNGLRVLKNSPFQGIGSNITNFWKKMSLRMPNQLSTDERSLTLLQTNGSNWYPSDETRHKNVGIANFSWATGGESTSQRISTDLSII